MNTVRSMWGTVVGRSTGDESIADDVTYTVEVLDDSRLLARLEDVAPDRDYAPTSLLRVSPASVGSPAIVTDLPGGGYLVRVLGEKAMLAECPEGDPPGGEP